MANLLGSIGADVSSVGDAYRGALTGGTNTHFKRNPPAQVIYNGFTFNPPRFRMNLRQRAEPSADGRTTLCNIYTLTVRGHISDDLYNGNVLVTSSGGTNPGGGAGVVSNIQIDQWAARGNLQSMRSRLSKNGGRLDINGLGCDLHLNTGVAGSMFDTRWGPKTVDLQINPVGNGFITEVLWVCEFALPECVSASGHGGHTAYGVGSASDDHSYIAFPFAQGDIEGFTFDVAYSIDRAGLTTRFITGEFSIAMNRSSVDGTGAFNAIPYVADEFRELISPGVPDHFQRVVQDFQMNPAKTHLRFRIVDVELPSENVFPPGVLNLRLTHTVNAVGMVKASSMPLTCSFTGEVEAVKGWPMGDAFDKCLLIMQQRLDVAKAAFAAANPEAGPNTVPVLVHSISISEELYGPRKIGFEVNYIIMEESKDVAFGNIIDRSGLFVEVDVDGIDDATYAESMQNTAWQVRGVSGLAFTPEEDAIVGPCEGIGGTVLDDIQLPTGVVEGGGSLLTNCPPEGRDYLGWDSEIDVDTDNKSAIHVPMKPTATVTASYGEVLTSDGASYLPSYRKPGDASYAPTGNFLASSSTIRIVLKGRAMRLGRWPELPSVNLEKFHEGYVNGIGDSLGRLIPGESRVKNKRMGKVGKCRIFWTKWEIEYKLTSLTDEADQQLLLEILNDSLVITPADEEGAKVGGKDQAADEPPP